MSLHSTTTLLVLGPLTLYIEKNASPQALVNAWEMLNAAFEIHLSLLNQSTQPQEAPPCEAATEIHQLESCSSANAGATATNETAAPSEGSQGKS